LKAYQIGDLVYCHESADHSLLFDMDFLDSRYLTFPVVNLEVIGYYQNFIVVLAPVNYTNTVMIDENFRNILGLGESYLGQNLFLLKEKSIGGRVTYDPYETVLRCGKCGEYYPWAINNREDGSFWCYVCRTDPRNMV